MATKAVQIYALEGFEVPAKWGDPYDSEVVQEQLREVGAVFVRDEDHSKGVVLQNVECPKKMKYFQFIYDNKTGNIIKIYVNGWDARVNWYDETSVNRVLIK